MKIAVIVIDALRIDRIGKRMREFLDSGLQWTQAYAAGTATIPSVPSFLTGMVPSQHGLVTPWSKLRVPTILDELKERKFRTVGYGPNGLASLKPAMFDEWKPLRWMSNWWVYQSERVKPDNLLDEGEWSGREAMKATQESYDDVWDDIANRKGDWFFYVHLMDVHEPFRQVAGVPLDTFPADYRTFRFVKHVNKAAREGQNALTNQQWDAVRRLYDAEVDYVDARLRFGIADVVMLTADHGQLLGEDNYLGHPQKCFREETLHVPFGMSGVAKNTKIDSPICLRAFPDFVRAILDGADLKASADLYWEDFWDGTASFAVKNAGAPTETLALHSDGTVWFMSQEGEVSTSINSVTCHMLRKLAPRMAEANMWPLLHREADKEKLREAVKEKEYPENEQKLIEQRLKDLGYL